MKVLALDLTIYYLEETGGEVDRKIYKIQVIISVDTPKPSFFRLIDR